MAGSIVDSLMSTLGPQIVGPIASRLGVSTDAVQSGLQGSSAALLSGIASKADQPGFLSSIYSLITNPANSAGALSSMVSNIGSSATGTSPLGDIGSKFTSLVLGSNQSAIADAIGRVSGLGGKAGTMLGMVAPLVLGFLGQHVRDNGLSASDLGNTLKGESSKLRGLLPAGLGSLLGGVGGLATAAAAAPIAAASGAKRWLWPLIVLAAIIIALLWFFNRAKPATEATAPPPAAPAASLPAGWVGLKLPDGVVLNVPESGIENQLVTFITDSSKPVDKTTWFNFDRLTFDTGKATLQQSSQEQLNNIVAILKAFPNVHAKIGGYTDNVGDAASNMKLSDDRAKNVMDAIVAGGIDQSRLESQGYGEEHPVADNSTEDGRAQNRRIALRVTQK